MGPLAVTLIFVGLVPARPAEASSDCRPAVEVVCNDPALATTLWSAVSAAGGANRERVDVSEDCASLRVEARARGTAVELDLRDGFGRGRLLRVSHYETAGAVVESWVLQASTARSTRFVPFRRTPIRPVLPMAADATQPGLRAPKGRPLVEGWTLTQALGSLARSSHHRIFVRPETSVRDSGVSLGPAFTARVSWETLALEATVRGAGGRIAEEQGVRPASSRYELGGALSLAGRIGAGPVVLWSAFGLGARWSLTHLDEDPAFVCLTPGCRDDAYVRREGAVRPVFELHAGAQLPIGGHLSLEAQLGFEAALLSEGSDARPTVIPGEDEVIGRFGLGLSWGTDP
ncbi:MAG: hypothetical protein IT384_07605 [Deltaproteobacteria bacterium]|nr:hypothetical protein [Deltaproteobacteria bacterium]